MAEVTYCNTTTDLQSIEPNIDSYDSKRVLTGFVLHSGSVYKKANSGYVELLYRNGLDLGSAEASLVAVDAEDEWYYDSDDDVVYLHTDPSSDNIDAGQDWDTYKTRVVAEASEFVRSYIARPILKRKDSASSRDYDMVLIKGTAYLACSMIILPYNFEKAQQLEWKSINPEDESGILDRLKRGDYKLWNEVSEEKREGKVLKTSTEGSTSDVVDVRGKATVSWDIIKVKITSSGTNTLTHGSDSTATYSTWISSSEGLQTSQVYNNQTVTGGYDHIGHGIQVRWSEGDLVEDEIWEVEVSADPIDHPKIRKINLSRK